MLWYIPKQGCENENKEEFTCWYILDSSQSFWVFQQVHFYKGLVKRGYSFLLTLFSSFNWMGSRCQAVNKEGLGSCHWTLAPSKTAAVWTHRRPWQLLENALPPLSHTPHQFSQHILRYLVVKKGKALLPMEEPTLFFMHVDLAPTQRLAAHSSHHRRKWWHN